MKQQLEEQAVDYDIVIVGGGIQGVGIAQICAAAGYRCLLLEKNELASATSRSSSKLIHGGLRYLESAELSMVHECLKERSWLLKQAPTLVKPTPFYIPVYQHSVRPAWMIQLGLSIYAMLCGFSKYARFKRIPREDWEAIPDLNQQELKAVFQYWDATTDDQLLTQAVMRSATELGAEFLCAAEVMKIKQERSFHTISYRHDGELKHCNARFLVNAAGPWVNELQSRIEPASYQLPADLVQGIHLIIKGHVLSSGVLYLEHPDDQRAVFVMPWYGNTLLGTTERIVSQPEDIAVSEQEKQYLLTLWEHYFPNAPAQIVGQMVGARVLPVSNKSSFKRSREARLLAGRHSVAVYGGKLTSYRAIARKVLAEITRQMGKRSPKADFEQLLLK